MLGEPAPPFAFHGPGAIVPAPADPPPAPGVSPVFAGPGEAPDPGLPSGGV